MAKNLLEQHIAAQGKDHNSVMNLLQEYGLISDLCVHACDVEDEDAKWAVEFLRSHIDPRRTL